MRAKDRQKYPGEPRSGFSLIELLVVIGMMVILLGMVLPAWNSVSSGMELTATADNLGDAITLARQEAITRGKKIGIAFLTRTNGATVNYGWQVVEYGGNATTITNRLARRTWMPEAIVPDLTESPLSGTGWNATNFFFRANGRLEGLDAANNYITLRPRNAGAANFITLQINPVTGKVFKYQP